MAVIEISVRFVVDDESDWDKLNAKDKREFTELVGNAVHIAVDKYDVPIDRDYGDHGVVVDHHQHVSTYDYACTGCVARSQDGVN